MDACPCCGEAMSPSAELCASCAAELGSTDVPGGTPPPLSAGRSPNAAQRAAAAKGLDLPVLCPKCGHPHAPGVFRCYACNASLRPVWLGIITVAGPILLVILSLFVMDDFRRGKPVAIDVALNAVGFALLLGLRFGRNWAWIAIQILWLVNLGLVGTAEIRASGTIRVTLVYALVIAVHWVYLHLPRVRAFCSVGRWPK